MKRCLLLLPGLALLAASGCATTQKPVQGVERGIAPVQAAADESLLNKRLQWGGVIVEGKNLADATELQILAYPLKNNGRPDVTEAPSGRFIARRAGYLETADYAVGRQVTATGAFVATRRGEVGKAPYDFPLLQADELILWPRGGAGEAQPRVNFGFGVGSGGRSWGGVGIGIGF